MLHVTAFKSARVVRVSGTLSHLHNNRLDTRIHSKKVTMCLMRNEGVRCIDVVEANKRPPTTINVKQRTHHYRTFDLSSSPHFDPSFLPFEDPTDSINVIHFRHTKSFFTPPRDPLLYSRGEKMGEERRKYGTS